MTTQRDKDREAFYTLASPNNYPSEDFCDGAEYARKQLARRLSGIMDSSELCGFGSDYKSHLKYYEEVLSYLVCELNGGTD